VAELTIGSAVGSAAVGSAAAAVGAMVGSAAVGSAAAVGAMVRTLGDHDEDFALLCCCAASCAACCAASCCLLMSASLRAASHAARNLMPSSLSASAEDAAADACFAAACCSNCRYIGLGLQASNIGAAAAATVGSATGPRRGDHDEDGLMWRGSLCSGFVMHLLTASAVAAAIMATLVVTGAGATTADTARS
jgi:hypothetical protein